MKKMKKMPFSRSPLLFAFRFVLAAGTNNDQGQKGPRTRRGLSKTKKNEKENPLYL